MEKINSTRLELHRLQLLYAAETGDLGLVGQMVDAGTDIDVTDDDGHTALSLAVRHRHQDAIRLLLDRGAAVDRPGGTALHDAASLGFTEVVELLLLARGEPASAKGDRLETPLHSGAARGNASMVELLLKWNIDVDATDAAGCTALHQAARYNNLPYAKALLDHGAQIDAVSSQDGETPLHRAARAAAIGVLELLLQRGARMHAGKKASQSVLQAAVQSNDAATLALVIKHGAQLDQRDAFGQTALHTACRLGHSVAVDVLVDHGARLDVFDAIGNSPIHEAALEKSAQALERLLRGVKNPSILDARNAANDSALMIAKTKSNRLANLLIAHGAHYDSHTAQGFPFTLQLCPVFKRQGMALPDWIELLINWSCGGTLNSPAPAASLKDLAFEKLCREMDSYGPDSLVSLVRDGLPSFAEMGRRSTSPYESRLVTTCLHCLAWTLMQRSRPDGSSKPVPDAVVREIHSRIEAAGFHEDYRQAKANLACMQSVDPTSTLMTWAVEQGNLPLVRLLVEMGFSVHMPDLSSFTPLHHAVNLRQYPICMILLQRGARIDIPSISRGTVQDLVLEEKLDPERWLKPASRDAWRDLSDARAKSADPAPNEITWSSLKLAVQSDSSKELQALFTACTPRQVHDWLRHRSRRRGTTLLHKAACVGRTETLLYLIELGASVNATRNDGASALHLAVKTGQRQVIPWLLEHSASIDARDGWGLTPLAYAVRGADAKTMQLLLQMGASLSGTNAYIALTAAIELGQSTIFEMLKDKIGTWSLATMHREDDLPILHVAAMQPDGAALRSLMNLRLDDTVLDKEGNNVLHWAAHRASGVPMAVMRRQLFIQRNQAGQLPLHVAAIHGNRAFLEELLNHSRGMIDDVDAQGRTALHLASLHNHPECIELLIAHQIFIDAQDHDLKTALQLAAAADHEPAVKALLRGGPFIDVRWLSKRTPMTASMTALRDDAQSKGLLDSQSL